MKLSLFVLATLALVATITGCSSGDGEIAIDAATTPLTAEGNDQLFTIRLVDAREGGYALDGLVVKALPDGKDAIVLSCTPSDTNGNQKLEKGETIACSEGSTNELGPDLAGKEIDVELYAKIDDEEQKVGGATWTVAK
jgi:hypothetical protein